MTNKPLDFIFASILIFASIAISALFIYEPIEKGSIWVVIVEKDPFKPLNTTRYKILDIKDGYLQLEITPIDDHTYIDSMSEDAFRDMRPVEQIEKGVNAND